MVIGFSATLWKHKIAINVDECNVRIRLCSCPFPLVACKNSLSHLFDLISNVSHNISLLVLLIGTIISREYLDSPLMSASIVSQFSVLFCGVDYLIPQLNLQ